MSTEPNLRKKSKQEDSRAQNHSQDAQTVLHRPPINSEPGAASVRDQAGDADRAGDRERTNQLLDEYNELKRSQKKAEKRRDIFNKHANNTP